MILSNLRMVESILLYRTRRITATYFSSFNSTYTSNLCNFCRERSSLAQVKFETEKQHIRRVSKSVKRYRTLHCADVSKDHVGSEQLFSGWVKYVRNLGKSSFGFLVLTDHTGDLQFVLRDQNKSDHQEDSFSNVITPDGFLWSDVTAQSAMTIRGMVLNRPATDVNPEMESGAFEVLINEVLFCNSSAPVPFNIYKPQFLVREDIRLQYRYLDLRRQEMQKVLRFRSSVMHKMRRVLVEKLFFTEIETPTLFRSSPGGAKEFLVASQQPDHYFALTQSPQQLKQLLMVGMVDRYFQFAKCYRDESQFSDRQLEFTQLDLEVSFESKEFIQDVIERIIWETWPSEISIPPSIPFKRMSYDEVFSNYGTDKPDLRYEDIKLKKVPSDLLRKLNNPVLDQHLNAGYGGRGLLIKNGQKMTRASVKKNVQIIEKELRWMVSVVNIGQDGRWHHHPFQKAENETVDDLNLLFKCEEGDILFLCCGPEDLVCTMLGRVRANMIENLREVSKFYQRNGRDFRFLWVEDFPLFERRIDNDKEIWVASHHPFTAPRQDDIEFLESDPSKVRGQHFDLVLNGNEIAGGSMRISDSKVQQKILGDILKLDCCNFQYLIDALSYGAPVHGGIAIGLDRYFAVILGKKSIRDVIAFPKSNKTGACLMSDAPSRIELGG
ncbi:aspartate--tRNA ligase, mitochondrial-like [Convolutriloba macropyga]|uniref:aspartate--tRNA ligase, mitochondrial-like n=1 Tax=Convolutriloba macropyga TaxID=536237 RepID=UPI003F51E802